MNQALRILIVEDSEDDAVLVLEELRRGGYEIASRRVQTGPDFKTALAAQEWDIILADHSLPQFDAVSCLRLLHESGLDLPFLIVSGSISEEVAVATMQNGAHDCISKNGLARLVPAVGRELREARVRRERRSAEEDRSRLAAIVEYSDDAIVAKNLKGTITSWNRGAERIFGYTEEEALGQPLTMLLPPEQLQEESRIFEQVKQGRSFDHFETVRLRKDGSRIDVSVTVSPILDADGRVIGASKIARDITARKQAEDELRASREQLRALAARLQSVREEERKRIARELHDELGQSLTGFKMDLVWLRNRLQANDAPLKREPLVEKIGMMAGLLDGVAGLMRKLCTELRPGVLDDLGLTAAMEWLAREYQNRTGIRCDLTLEAGELTVDPERSTALFRILQELLTNVARHAQATRVTVLLKGSPTHLLMEVEDNGRGIKEPEKAGAKSLGLVGLRERAFILGGGVQIEGMPGKGTRVRVTMPLHEVAGQPEVVALP
jgi:two-component system sensor histidine kinase UhpB